MGEDLFATPLRGFSLFQAETAQLPPAVLAWMWAMRIPFGASVVFFTAPGRGGNSRYNARDGRFALLCKGPVPEPSGAACRRADPHCVVDSAYRFSSLFDTQPAGARRPRLDWTYAIWRTVALGMLAVSLVFDDREVVTALA